MYSTEAEVIMVTEITSTVNYTVSLDYVIVCTMILLLLFHLD